MSADDKLQKGFVIVFPKDAEWPLWEIFATKEGADEALQDLQSDGAEDCHVKTFYSEDVVAELKAEADRLRKCLSNLVGEARFASSPLRAGTWAEALDKAELALMK